MDDVVSMASFFNKQFKKKKVLFCEFCPESKKSVVGFLSHYAVCKRSDGEIEKLKVKCDYCDLYKLPATMPVHVSSSHSSFCVRKYNKVVSTPSEKNEEDDGGEPRKRRAACQ